MYTLSDLQLFLRTADTRNLSAAARQLQVTPAAASAALKRLEAALEVRLFERSTRALRLTPEGEVFRDYCSRALGVLGDGEVQVRQGRRALSGTVHLAAPTDLTRTVLMPWLDEFQQLNPDIELVVHVSDTVQDLLRDTLQLALRYGNLPDSRLQARRLHPGTRVLAASPDYLRRHGTPEHPHDLAQHNCLTFYTQGQVNRRWTFYRDGKPLAVTVQGHRSSDDSSLARMWALQGHGLIYKCVLELQDDLQAGRLQALLPGYTREAVPLSAVFAEARYLPLRVRVLLDFFADKFAALAPARPVEADNG